MFNTDRFNATGGESQEQEAPKPEVKLGEIELRKRESDLKARYEDPFRRQKAEELLKERNRLRQEEKEQIQKLQGYLSSSRDSFEQMSEGQQKKPKEAVQVHETELQNLAKKQEEIKSSQGGRSFFQKLKYRFVDDPLGKELNRIDQAKTEHEQKAGEYRKEQQTVEKKWSAKLAEAEQNLTDSMERKKEEFQLSRKALLEKTRGVNRDSREAIRNTFLSMEKGELDIAKLAKQENAVVVHTIPLDGWNMRNTSMNNKEVEVEKLTAKEKADILLTKQPDVSASVLKVDRIEDQDMFYPFGYILGGTLVAAYEGDEGTQAAGDVRRRKEEHHGTLQSNPKEQFATVAQSAAKKNFQMAYNESIVHKPSLVGVLIDEKTLTERKDLGDSVTEYFPGSKEEEITAKYGNEAVGFRGVPTKGPYAGQDIFRVTRNRTAMQKAVEFAKEHHPELPVYLRKEDGIYTLDGKKVTAEDIYGK